MNLFKKHQNTSGYKIIPNAIAADDETAAVPFGTTIRPPSTTTMTMGRHFSKKTKTTKKKGCCVVRVSTAFGNFALLLLGVVIFADRGGKINNNIVNNNILSSGKEILYYCLDNVWETEQCSKGEEFPDYPDIKRGICETTGSYNDGILRIPTTNSNTTNK